MHIAYVPVSTIFYKITRKTYIVLKVYYLKYAIGEIIYSFAYAY